VVKAHTNFDFYYAIFAYGLEDCRLWYRQMDEWTRLIKMASRMIIEVDLRTKKFLNFKQ